MAETVLELHRARQAGAEYAAESAALYRKAQLELDESRRLVFRQRHAEAEEAARRGLAYATRARELAREPEPLPARDMAASVSSTLPTSMKFATSPAHRAAIRLARTPE